MVLPDGRLVGELVGEHLHLLVELAEDDPLGRLLGLRELTLERDELRARRIPVGTVVEPRLALAGIDVDLRVQRELAKAHQHLEHRARVVGLESAPAAHDETLRAAIELRLLLRQEVQLLLLDARGVGELGHHSAHLLHRAVETGLADDLRQAKVGRQGTTLIADERQQHADITKVVDDRRGCDSPERAVLESGDALVQLPRLVLDAVSLVENNATPATLAQVRVADELLVVRDEDERSAARVHGRPQPPARGRRRLADVDVGADGGRAPLGDDGLRAEQESLELAAVQH